MRNQKNLIMVFFVLFFLFFLFLDINSCFADDPLGLAHSDNIGLANEDVGDPRVLLVNIVKFFLSFLGLIAVSMVMWAGFLWMTSDGDPAKVDLAKKTLINAVIGLMIVVASFTIVLYVERLFTDGFSDGGGESSFGGSSSSGLAAQGNRAIESHYPESNQRNVARNTMIIVTFKEPIDVSTVIEDTNGSGILGDWLDDGDLQLEVGEYDEPLDTSVRLALKDEAISGPVVDNLYAQVTDDSKSFVFSQTTPYIGSPSLDVEHSVYLTSNIMKANGDAIWSGFDTGYIWSFETGTVIDMIPPQVKSVVPYPDATEPRNVVIQINFDEAMSPISVGSAGSYNIDVIDGATSVVGTFFISNAYKTVEFLTTDICGVNPCGQTVYCLPANASMSVLVNAATIGSFNNGLTDTAGNSMDGNKDGIAEGPESVTGSAPFNENLPDLPDPGDDYTWSFSTNDTIDITAPSIISINPNIGDTNVNTRVIPGATFSKQLMKSSATKNSPPGSGSVSLYSTPLSSEVYYWLNVENDDVLRQGTIFIKHDDFFEDSSYIPEFNSGIKDIYQNCYRPDGVGGDGPSCVPNPPLEPYCCSGIRTADACGDGGTPVYDCGDGTCEVGECAANCSDDCDRDDCCGIEGCNRGVGETEDNCALADGLDCDSSPTPPPPPIPPVL